VIAFTTLDEALARFGALGVSVVIVALTQPAARMALFRAVPRLCGALSAVAADAFRGEHPRFHADCLVFV
jgi:hypothetical protein